MTNQLPEHLAANLSADTAQSCSACYKKLDEDQMAGLQQLFGPLCPMTLEEQSDFLWRKTTDVTIHNMLVMLADVMIFREAFNRMLPDIEADFRKNHDAVNALKINRQRSST